MGVGARHDALALVLERLARDGTFAGPLTFGLAKDATGSSRTAILFLAVFFVLGALLLATVNVAEGQSAAAAGDSNARQS